MGDSRRNTVFATFIKSVFGKKVQTILVVADGKGELSRSLANKGYRITTIEAKPRFQGRGHKRIDYRKGWFDSGHPITQDAVVAMHPDEATSEVVLAATEQSKRFAVVPCCIKGRFSGGVTGYQGWISKLKSLAGHRCCVTALRISGKNIVLYRR